jgi:hypothetical protein
VDGAPDAHTLLMPAALLVLAQPPAPAAPRAQYHQPNQDPRHQQPRRGPTRVGKRKRRHEVGSRPAGGAARAHMYCTEIMKRTLVRLSEMVVKHVPATLAAGWMPDSSSTPICILRAKQPGGERSRVPRPSGQ